MIRFAMMFLLCGLCAPAAAQDPHADSLFVLPGTFSQRTTVAGLQTRFGKSNVKITEERGDDGTLLRSVVLFPDDPTRRAYVDFHDARALTDLRSILVNDAGSRWRGKHDVRVGMSFAELRNINGKPFWFTGFDDQQRGSSHDQWSPTLDGDDGKLGALDVEEEDHMYFGVELGLRGQARDIPVDAYPGEESISSDDPRYPRLGELVVVTAINATTSLDDEWE